MVQILPPKPPSFGKSLLLGAAQAAPQAIENYYSKLARQKQEQQAIETSKRFGLDTEGFDSDTRRALLVEKLRHERPSMEQFEDPETDAHLEKAFGREFADLWKIATPGGKTKLIKEALDSKLRGQDLNALIGGESAQKDIPSIKDEKPIPQMIEGKVPEDFEWPDFTKPEEGYTPKDWREEKKTWRKENAPIFSENKELLQQTKKDLLAVKNLQKLSPKLPAGIEKAIINPSTGEPYALAQLAGKVTPEVQSWVKEIARFQNRAKNAFGARVTNFDLVSYMKQFPGLLNSEEGRRRILRMMEINYELDNLHRQSLRKVYDHYGLNGISQEKADEFAEGFIKDETSSLEDEYLNIDEENIKKESTEELSGEEVEVMDENGNIVGTISIEHVGELPPGYRIK